MEFSIAALLASFGKDKTLTLKNLEKKLHCSTETSQRDLQIAVDALERIGVLVKERGKYRRHWETDVVEGKLRCSSKGFCFAIQDQEGADDIYVRESHLNTAWNGDRVLVKVTKEGSGRRSPEGEVQLILERANASVLARVKQEDGQYRAVPLDDRLLFELSLPPNGADLEAAVDQLAHVEIVRYPLGQTPPQGRVAQILGSDAEAAADIDIVYCKHDLPRSFPEAVLAAAAALPSRLRKADLNGRVDLRKVLTLSIHGPNLPMIDDALSLEKLDNGNWRLGIHIADLAHYVEPHSPIDQEAAKRGTAVYLGDEVIPMLPPPLLGSLSALEAGKDRLAMSVLVTLDEAGTVQEYEIQPTVVNVDYQLTYPEAQAVLERDHPEALKALGIKPKTLKALAPAYDLVDDLLALTQAIKRQRLHRGSFELNLPEYDFPADAEEPLAHYRSPKFQYDDEGLLGVMVMSTGIPARTLVTECMLLANQLVAEHLKALGVPAIYRLHRAPEAADVQELVKLAENMEIQLTLANQEAPQPKDYQGFVEQFSNSNAEKILTYLLLETIQPAFYSTHPDLHFGLGLADGYTHFTSPSRRYADLMVQRILHGVFESGRDRRSTRSKDRVNLHHSSCHGQISWNVLPPELQHELEDDLPRLVIHLSERERLAQEAESDLEGLKKAEFMRSHTGEIFHGLITGVQSYGFFVEIEELLVEGLVHVSSLKDDWYEYRARQQKLVGRKNRQQYRLGDKVDVQVKSVDYYRQQIDLVAVGGGSQVSDEEAASGFSEEEPDDPLVGHLASDESE
ncbi:MAG TPA: VacB/RNase II family 3'-5' exoribonuclease [Leptolyngbyaceae cyanobacterium M65_K2018_010]|nr:VacB/RNase II family 3'-5' exoribonuclease [Leptolyngbyaceae cyanobacterium M65_K2018_010]